MRLNPYAGVQKKTAKLVEAERKKQKQARSDQKRGVSFKAYRWSLDINIIFKELHHTHYTSLFIVALK